MPPRTPLGPGTVSDRLLWYRAGAWMDLPHEERGGAVPFRPPEAFNEFVAGVVGEGE